MNKDVEELSRILGMKIRTQSSKRTPCDICGSVYYDERDYNECRKHCDLMVKSYMKDHRLTRQQAITQIRLEMM